MKELFVVSGAFGYLSLWVILPVFQLATAGLIYRGVQPGLVPYAVVGVTASTAIWNMLYYVGQVLDEERIRGTLVGLFLSPSPRISWLTGFCLAGAFETLMAALATVIFGSIVFGVRFHPNVAALALTIPLFVIALWGLGFVFSAIGLASRRSNDVANLVSPVILLLGGVYYPISALPEWLRIPAHALPIEYGVQALVGAALYDRGILTLGSYLMPLVLFAVGLPIAGLLAFGWVERSARARGQLDLY